MQCAFIQTAIHSSRRYLLVSVQCQSLWSWRFNAFFCHRNANRCCCVKTFEFELFWRRWLS